jgi:hypothetical protein
MEFSKALAVKVLEETKSLANSMKKGRDCEKDYKSAENLSIDLKSKNIFPTFTCRPIDGAIVGCTEANTLVYIDDCVKNHEEARNRDRLEFLCEKVTDDVLGRRLEGTPIIIQGTKYSLYDPITALQNKADELGWRWREVAVPALDPITDESNWEIYRKDKKGLRKIFTTDYYRKERKLVSEETWAAEFQQEPYEAKGRMFAENELNYFEELPIDREPDAIMAACDSADKGEDSCSMPIGYIFGNEVYIVDVVFDNAGTQFTKPECANMLIRHNAKAVTFESNSAGEYFGRDVMEIVKSQGGRCSARFKFNCSNKITRMENARAFLFIIFLISIASPDGTISSSSFGKKIPVRQSNSYVFAKFAHTHTSNPRKNV